MKLSVTLPLTAEFLSIGDLELAQVNKVGYGAIADIKMRVQVRSTLWKYNKREIQRYIRQNGTVPFAEWFTTLRDVNAKIRIDKRLQRVSGGNLGDYRSVGAGVWELRIDYGPGYRIYFGQAGATIVLILCGGDKSTQDQDIVKAQEYWRDYERRQSADE